MGPMENDVAAMFRRIDRIRRAWCAVTPCDALSKSQFSTLLAIAFQDRMRDPPGRAPGDGEESPQRERSVTLTELARGMRQSLPALSQRVSALEAQGYIERVPDPADRRVTGVRVTWEGMRVLEQARQRLDGMLLCATARMGREKLHTLLALMDELAEGLEAVAKGTGEES